MSKIIKLHKNPGTVRILRAGRQEVGQLAGTAAGFVPLDDANDRQESEAETCESGVVYGTRPGLNALAEEYERGFRDGKAAVEAMFREENRANLLRERGRVDTLLTSVTEQIASFQDKAEQTAIRFSLAVAERIVKREVKLDNQIVLREIKEALRRVLGAERVTIHVHPTEEEAVRNHRTTISSGFDSIREILIEADDNIAPGGCIIESSSGNVDARIETQIKKVEASMFGQL